MLFIKYRRLLTTVVVQKLKHDLSSYTILLVSFFSSYNFFLLEQKRLKKKKQ